MTEKHPKKNEIQFGSSPGNFLLFPMIVPPPVDCREIATTTHATIHQCTVYIYRLESGCLSWYYQNVVAVSIGHSSDVVELLYTPIGLTTLASRVIIRL